jgi:hypothetical protein
VRPVCNSPSGPSPIVTSRLEATRGAWRQNVRNSRDVCRPGPEGGDQEYAALVKQPLSEPPRWPPHWWHRLHPLALTGMVLIGAGSALFGVAMFTNSMWLWGGSIAGVGLGLMLIVQALIPDRNMQGTKVWQNDGLPGG